MLREQFYRLIHDLPELSPVGEVSLVHSLLNGRQYPANARYVIYRPIGVGPREAGHDARSGIAIVLRNTGDGVVT